MPPGLQEDPEMWSGCISGAFREDRFLAAFEEAGFHGIEIFKRQRDPWRTVEGIEFRSVTVVAHKGKKGPCLERNQAVIYRGPFKCVQDDDGHVYQPSARMQVRQDVPFTPTSALLGNVRHYRATRVDSLSEARPLTAVAAKSVSPRKQGPRTTRSRPKMRPLLRHRRALLLIEGNIDD